MKLQKLEEFYESIYGVRPAEPRKVKTQQASNEEDASSLAEDISPSYSLWETYFKRPPSPHNKSTDQFLNDIDQWLNEAVDAYQTDSFKDFREKGNPEQNLFATVFQVLDECAIGYYIPIGEKEIAELRQHLARPPESIASGSEASKAKIPTVDRAIVRNYLEGVSLGILLSSKIKYNLFRNFIDQSSKKIELARKGGTIKQKNKKQENIKQKKEVQPIPVELIRERLRTGYLIHRVIQSEEQQKSTKIDRSTFNFEKYEKIVQTDDRGPLHEVQKRVIVSLTHTAPVSSTRKSQLLKSSVWSEQEALNYLAFFFDSDKVNSFSIEKLLLNDMMTRACYDPALVTQVAGTGALVATSIITNKYRRSS